ADQEGDPSGRGPCLPASRTVNDQERPGAMGHGLLLGRVHALEQRVDLGLRGLGNHGSNEFTEPSAPSPSRSRLSETEIARPVVRLVVPLMREVDLGMRDHLLYELARDLSSSLELDVVL